MSAGTGRLRPSPAMLVAVVALVFAVTGAAVALPGKGSVDKNDLAKKVVKTKTIKNGAVTGAKLKAGAVTGDKLADGAVGSGKIAAGAVTADKVAPGVLQPIASAYVDNSPAIVAANSEGMGSATVTLDESFVCFYNLPFTPKNIQVTVVRPGGGIEDVFPNVFQPNDDNSFCDGTEGASVQFYDASSDTTDGSPPRFHVTFFN